MTVTQATTESTLLRDIAAAIARPRDGANDAYPIAKRAAHLFAQTNDWRWHPSFSFPPEYLGKYGDEYWSRPSWCDHALFFRGQIEGKRGWPNIAIAGQPYQWSEDVCTELADLERRGFVVHTPPGGDRASIHFPGKTLFIVVTRPGVIVKWLPEQR
jgi:hypothetical protein